MIPRRRNPASRSGKHFPALPSCGRSALPPVAEFNDRRLQNGWSGNPRSAVLEYLCQFRVGLFSGFDLPTKHLQFGSMLLLPFLLLSLKSLLLLSVRLAHCRFLSGSLLFGLPIRRLLSLASFALSLGSLANHPSGHLFDSFELMLRGLALTCRAVALS